MALTFIVPFPVVCSTRCSRQRHRRQKFYFILFLDALPLITAVAAISAVSIVAQKLPDKLARKSI